MAPLDGLLEASRPSYFPPCEKYHDCQYVTDSHSHNCAKRRGCISSRWETFPPSCCSTLRRDIAEVSSCKKREGHDAFSRRSVKSPPIFIVKSQSGFDVSHDGRNEVEFDSSLALDLRILSVVGPNILFPCYLNSSSLASPTFPQTVQKAQP